MAAEQTLDDAIRFIQGSTYDVTIALATFDTDADRPTYRSLNISEGVADEFSELAGARVEPVRRDRANGDCRVLEYSEGFTPDRHVVEYLTTNDPALGGLLESFPSASHITLLGDIDDFVDDLRFYALVLSGSNRRAVLFRRFNRNRELQRSKNIVLRLAGNQYDRLTEPTFQFDTNIDAVLFRDHLFVLRKHDFRHIFRYNDLLREAAEQSLDTIRSKVPIANFDEFRDSCLGHLQKLEKLRNIAQKPYLDEITMDDIKRTIAEFELDVEVAEDGGQESLVFDQSDRWAILNLLDDAYLGSSMTGRKYEANSKREV